MRYGSKAAPVSNQALQRPALSPAGAFGLEPAGGHPRRSFALKRVFAVPAGLRIYAIGDIHGCHAELEILLNLIEQDLRGAQVECRLIYLGDYIDRGPASKKVVDRVLKTKLHFLTTCLRGNHDQILLDFLEDPTVYPIWQDIGGRETLLSYGVAPPQVDDSRIFVQARDALWRALPENHLQFFHSLNFSATIGDYFFVHAGVRPGIALEDQRAEDMLWIRNLFLHSSNDFGAMIVHGHTPFEQPVRHANRMGLDTGAYATGCLTAAVLEGTEFRFLHT
jgi:serine/threonine protein phosphatase 1